MRNIVKFAVGNPVTIYMLVMGILLMGKISYDRLSIDLLPDMSSPRLFVEIRAGERPPEEIEKQWISNMESLAVRQSDVVQVSSIIRAGSARMTVEYSWGKDMDEAFLDLQKAMTPFAQSEDITELKITQHDPNASPVVLIGMSHETVTDMAELSRVAENYIRSELIRLEGVAEVSLSGQEKVTLTVQTDPYRLDAFGLTVDDIAGKITASNRNISGGRVSEMGLQYMVKTAGMLTSAADFENLIVGYRPVEAQPAASSTATAAEKAPVYLREAATIQFENARPENIVRMNGKRCMGLSVYKEMRFNTVNAVDNVIRQLDIIGQALPGYRFQVITSQGTFIKNAIGEVKNSALTGILLAVTVLFLFLRRIGTTLIVSIAIPVSIIATFNLMFFGGLTLNIMTLGGLALGAGMLVDNAVVVIESIFQNRERGLSLREAVITGTSEVSGAIIASTLTTIVVFLPIVYLHGAAGELFKDQAWTVTFSLISSLFAAILVIPVLFDRLGSRPAKKNTHAAQPVRIAGYGNMLRRLLRHRRRIIGAAAVIIAGTAMALPHIGTEFMPRTESKTFTILVKMPEGTPLERTAAAVAGLENLIYTITGDSLTTIYSHTGTGSNPANAILESENTAMLKIILPPACPLTPDFVTAQLLHTAENPGELDLSIQHEENTLSALLSTEGAPLTVEIEGEEPDGIAATVNDVKNRMQTIPELHSITTSIEHGAPEAIITINRTAAGIHNLTAATVIEQLKQQLSGAQAGSMDYRGEMRSITVKLPAATLHSLGSLTISNGSREFRLHEIATITHAQAPGEIHRRNRRRTGLITAGIHAGTSLDRAAQEIRAATSGIGLPPRSTITVTGQEQKRQESLHSLLFALSLSIVLVYMVLASQFESLLHPFTILLTIPLALSGAIAMFLLTGTALNIMALIGIIMLAGISVNNSILLVDRINRLKALMPLIDAIVEAGQQRIRPILMTTLTTILALLPLMLSSGEGASLRSPMAMSVVGGLLASTLMSLIVIPCVYCSLEHLKARFRK